MDITGFIALGILTVAVILWLTNIIPVAVTSLLVIAASALFNILTFEEAAAGLGKDVIWLIIAMLFMGAALAKTGLDKRLAYTMLGWARGKVKHTVYMIILFAFVLTFFVPNAAGRVIILVPISLGLINALGLTPKDNTAKLIILTNTFIPIVTSSALLTGSSGSIYAAGLFADTLSYQWDYLFWFVAMMPPVLLTVLCYAVFIFRLFPPEAKDIPGGLTFIKQELHKMGPLSRQELKLSILYLILILLWITKGINGFSLSLSALLVAVALFLPGIKLLDWNEAKGAIDWGVPFIFAAGFTIAQMLDKSGVVNQMVELTQHYLGELSPFKTALALMVLLVIIRLVFNNYTTMVASLLPVVLTFALATSFNPLWLGMIAVTASSIGYLLPTQTVASMTTFSTGYITGREFFTAGLIITVLMILFTLLFANFYWPLIGLNIYL